MNEADQRPEWLEAASKPGHARPHEDQLQALVAKANQDAEGQGKRSNPKDVIGSTKLSMFIVPDTLTICAAMGFLEGALKYGRFNWRIAGVRASIYIDALDRHIAKWKNGQDCDKLTKVHHLDNAIACLGIMRDAMIYGKLMDDRPPCPNPDAIAELIDAQGKTIAHLKATFASHNPYQFTIADTRPSIQTIPGDDQKEPQSGA